MKFVFSLAVFSALLFIYACGPVSSAGSLDAFVAPSSPPPISFLYTLSAEIGKIEHSATGTVCDKDNLCTLILSLDTGSRFNTIDMFSDRPARLAHPVSLTNVLNTFYGSGTFATVPPNASLYYFTKDRLAGKKVVFVTLLKPKLNKSTGQLTFQFKTLRGSSQKNLDFTDINNITMFIDNGATPAFEGLGHDIVHTAETIGHDIDRGGEIVVHGIETVADDVGDGVVIAADDIAKGVTEAGNDIKDAAKDMEEEFGTIGNDIGSAVVWFFDEAKCYIVEGALDVTGVVAEGIVDFATDGEASLTWEEFVAAMKGATAKEGATQIFANLVERIAKAAGASDGEGTCIKGLSGVIFSQALEWGSFSAFTIDMIKGITMAKIGCDSFVSACF